MATKLLTQEQYREAADLIAIYGSAEAAARESGIPATTLKSRMSAGARSGFVNDSEVRTYPRVKNLTLTNGSIIVSSDHHYWPGHRTVAHEALIAVTKAVKPKIKILNGDIFDGVSLCRHPPFGWSKRPSVKEELEACQEAVQEIEMAVPRGCELIWNVGNHCIRFERALATKAPEFAGVGMFRLEDHFSNWSFQWSSTVNWDSQSPVMVKHRLNNGVHAGYNNAMKGGVTIVTGHTHGLEVIPYGNYRTNRYWAVQTGTLADLDGPQFEYTENGPPAKACSGFAVLTFVDGVLAPPEICEVIDGRAWFRGKVWA